MNSHALKLCVISLTLILSPYPAVSQGDSRAQTRLAHFGTREPARWWAAHHRPCIWRWSDNDPGRRYPPGPVTHASCRRNVPACWRAPGLRRQWL